MLYGSCLCGAVAYETQGLSGPIFHRNCRTCRKAHSAAFATTARTERAYFKWSRGREFLGHFESTPGKLRHFCTECGYHLMAEWTDEPEVILRLGCLDTDPEARPSTHIWTSIEFRASIFRLIYHASRRDREVPGLTITTPDKALQLKANPLCGLSAVELGRQA